MSGYIGNIPTPQATQTRDTFTATAGQTTFATSGYTPSFLDVFMNGVHLLGGGVDYTATNGSDVVLTSGAAAGDVVEVVAYSTFSILDDGAGSGLDADLLDGQQGSYYLDGNNFVNLPAGYSGWTVSDGTNSENIADSNTVTFNGSGATSVSYNTTSNTMTISSTDTNTTYSAGKGLSLSGTTFDMKSGTVIQMVHSTTSSTASSSSTSWVDAPNMSVTITPQYSNSKILIVTSGKFGANENSQEHAVRLLRGSTVIGQPSGNAYLWVFGNAGYSNTHMQNTTQIVQDSPNTTSAVTYKLQFRTNQGTMTFNITGSGGSVFGSAGYFTSTMTAFEIAQ